MSKNLSFTTQMLWFIKRHVCYYTIRLIKKWGLFDVPANHDCFKEKKIRRALWQLSCRYPTAAVSTLKPVVHRPGPFCNVPLTNLT